MADLISEVEESVRRDRYAAFFKKYGWWVAGALVALLVGVAGWQVWTAAQRQAAQTRTEALAAAVTLSDSGRFAEAAAALEPLSAQGPARFQHIVKLQWAEARLGLGDLAGAQALFEDVGQASKEPAVRDSALLRAAYLAAEAEDWQALAARLAPLTADESPLGPLGRELVGVKAWDAGAVEPARTEFAAILADPAASADLKARVEQWMAVLGPAPEAPAPAPQPPAAPAADPAPGVQP